MPKFEYPTPEYRVLQTHLTHSFRVEFRLALTPNFFEGIRQNLQGQAYVTWETSNTVVATFYAASDPYAPSPYAWIKWAIQYTAYYNGPRPQRTPERVAPPARTFSLNTDSKIWVVHFSFPVSGKEQRQIVRELAGGRGAVAKNAYFTGDRRLRIKPRKPWVLSPYKDVYDYEPAGSRERQVIQNIQYVTNAHCTTTYFG